MSKLAFGTGNAKLDKTILTFSLLSGFSCPGASLCEARVIEDKEGKRALKDGKLQQFRCFSASQELLYPNVYNSRKKNFELLLNIQKKKIESQEKVDQMSALILDSLKEYKKWDKCRIHVAGDYFSLEYLQAWIKVANVLTDKTFYCYTKSVHFLVQVLETIPNNFKYVASEGGKYDELIIQYGLKKATVVFSEEEAKILNIEIDHDDSHAYSGEQSFGLLIHGRQAAGSAANKAFNKVKHISSYGSKSKKFSGSKSTRENPELHTSPTSSTN